MKFPTRTVNLFLLWILFSLLAIAYIGQHPYLGLAIAVVGGIVLGVMSFLYYEPEPVQPPEVEEEEESTGAGSGEESTDATPESAAENTTDRPMED